MPAHTQDIHGGCSRSDAVVRLLYLVGFKTMVPSKEKGVGREVRNLKRERVGRESRPFSGIPVYTVGSTKRTVPAASSKMLEGLMSPWQIPKLWMYCKPLAAWINFEMAICSGRGSTA